MTNITEDIKTVLEFYQAMGIERIPLNTIQDTRYRIQDKKIMHHASCIVYLRSMLSKRRMRCKRFAMRSVIVRGASSQGGERTLYLGKAA